MIHIVRGVYGYLDKDGIVRPKTSADKPFELTEEQEARLVNLGIAQYVENVKDEQESEETAPEETEEVATEDEQNPVGFDETPPEDFVEDTEDDAEIVEEIVDLASLTAKELREIGTQYGLTFKANDKKDTMIKAITEAQNESVYETDEDAPTFDAAEAVL
jgi:hypothetical protein